MIGYGTSNLARYSSVAATGYLERLRSPALLDHPSLQGRGITDMPTERAPQVARTFALSYERLDLVPSTPVPPQA